MIHAYSAHTPNGWKIHIMLEECELPWELHLVDFEKGEQREDWFVKISPNARIPAIVDDGFSVFESGAILQYLAEKTGKFLPADHAGRWEVLQWLYWQMGGVGPMVGQSVSFNRYIPEHVPYAIARYHNESRRLFEVLDRKLEGNEYICGDVSIADFAVYPWVRAHKWAKVRLDGLGNVEAWLKRMRSRPGVERGLSVGVPETEVDQWSEARKKNYKKRGSSIVTKVD